MGINERKERDKEELKAKILEAAKELFISRGYEETSIRNIAEKIEYSPTTIYLYFKDKDSIFYELHRLGFMQMNQMFGVLQFVSDPFERLINMGRIYMQFAMENKEMYDLMFIMKAPINCIDVEEMLSWKEGQTGFDTLKMVVNQCIEKGYFKEQELESFSFLIWSSMHGICSLHIRQRCEHVISEENRGKIIPKAFEAFVNMLRAMKN